MGIIKRVISFIFFMSAITICAQTDVDNHIAVNDHKDPNTFVLIISNENYKYEQSVPFALNDGEVFKLYCEKTLGIPTKNIRFAADATLNDIRMQLMWLKDVMDAYQGEARAFVYYSGHGMPSEDGQHAYLLPIDGNSRLAGSGYSTEKLYMELGNMQSKGIIVFLDACFSGARRDGQMLASSRGVAIKVKKESLSGNLVVFSAAQGDETAYPYKEHKHGLFTYHLLSILQEKGGCISLGELCDEVTKKVSRTSIVENDKRQTPTVISSSHSIDWRNWMIATKPAKRYENKANNIVFNEKKDNNTSKDIELNKNSVNTYLANIDAANRGDSFAQLKVGICYMTGNGIKQDYEKAVEWYRKSAEQGNAEAQTCLGLCYGMGNGVQKDLSQAIKWWRKAANQNNAQAQYYLGNCYNGGTGVSVDYTHAALFYLKSAEQGHAGAQFMMGVYCRTGTGIQENAVDAASWWLKSAIQGNPEAQYLIGTCYENGDGIEKDQNQALYWYRKAAEQGHVEAKNKIR